jgi:hypothetical protein
MRTCAICGAKVKNINPRCNTCDPICTQQVNIDIFADRLVENGWLASEAQEEAARALADAGVEDGM